MLNALWNDPVQKQDQLSFQSEGQMRGQIASSASSASNHLITRWLVKGQHEWKCTSCQ